MSKTLAVTHPTARELSTDHLIEAAKAYASRDRSPRTLKEYRRDWRQFKVFCGARDFCSLPASPETIALYATALAEAPRKYSTITRAIAAISVAHKTAGHESPASRELVHRVLKGIANTIGVARTKKAPVVVADLRALVEKLPKSTAGVRDHALLVLGFAGALRRSELVALDLQDVVATRDGLEVTIRKSKTDQQKTGQKIGLPYGSHPLTCPVRTLAQWVEKLPPSQGAIFRAVTQRGKIGARLSDKDVARILKRACLAAGINPKTISGHSLRRGFVTSAARAGKLERDIMRQTRHKSVVMVREYIEEAGLFENNPASGIGL